MKTWHSKKMHHCRKEFLILICVQWTTSTTAVAAIFHVTSERRPGCQMANFQTKNPNLGKFCRVLQWTMLVYFMAIWSIVDTAFWYNLWPFGIFYGYLIFFPFWYVEKRKIWQA
jgi:hypothetical protein